MQNVKLKSKQVLMFYKFKLKLKPRVRVVLQIILKQT